MRCFRTRGKKGDEHFDPTAPPRRRAHKRPGRGTDANDRPPIGGTGGRETGPVRRRVVKDTPEATVRAQLQRFTTAGTQCSSDEYQRSKPSMRPPATVAQAANEWARDAAGDSIREGHGHTAAGRGTDVRNC